MAGAYEPAKPGRQHSDARETGSSSGRPVTRGGAFKANFNPADGSGDWSITIPPEADMHDVLALGPVIDSIRGYLAPTIAPDKPVGYQLVEAIEPPDLTA